jgi:hypothetical protein
MVSCSLLIEQRETVPYVAKHDPENITRIAIARPAPRPGSELTAFLRILQSVVALRKPVATTEDRSPVLWSAVAMDALQTVRSEFRPAPAARNVLGHVAGDLDKASWFSASTEHIAGGR